MADAKLTIKDLPTAVTVAEDADLLALWDDSDNTTSQFSVADLKTSVINPLIAAEAALRSAADVTLQNNIDLKADTDSPTLTGIPLAPTATSGTDTDQLATTAFVKTAVDAASGAVVSVNGATGAVVLDATSVGLGDFTGLTPATLPLSTAETAALATKEPSISSGLSSQVWQGDKTWVAKTSLPISTAQQTALDTKEPNITVGTTGDYWRGDKTFQPVLDLPISTAVADALSAIDISKLTHIATLAGLAAYAQTAYPVYCRSRTTVGDGYAGVFEWMAGNQTANITLDALSAIWVAPSSDPTGASGAWRRVFEENINLAWFGAKGDGTTDDTVAVQAAFNFNLPIVPVGTFLLSAKITAVSNLCLRGLGKKNSQFVWTAAAASSGIEFIAAIKTDYAIIEDCAFWTKKAGSGTAIRLDYTAVVSGGAVTPRGHIARNDIQGATAANIDGWALGIEVEGVVNTTVENNNVVGYWVGSLLGLVTETGIWVHRGTADQGVSARVHKNTVITCQNGCIINDIEGVWCDKNDFQTCYIPLTIANLGSDGGTSTDDRKTQVRVSNCHLSGIHESFILQGVHHFKVWDNEIYHLDTSTSATSLMRVRNSSYGVFSGNSFRNRIMTVQADGVTFDLTDGGQLGVFSFVNNIFFQCWDQIVAPSQLTNIWLDDSNIYYSPQGKTWGISYGAVIGVGTDANTTPKTLATRTIYANSFRVERSIEIEARGIFQNTTTVKTVSLMWGATKIAEVTGTIKNGTWWFTGRISYLSAGNQRWAILTYRTPTTTEIIPGTAASGVTTVDTPMLTFSHYGSSTETDTSDIAVSVVGQNGSANAADIVCTYFRVGFVRG